MITDHMVHLVDRLGAILFLSMAVLMVAFTEGLAWGVRRSRRVAGKQLLQVPFPRELRKQSPWVAHMHLVVGVIIALVLSFGWALTGYVPASQLCLLIFFIAMTTCQYRQQAMMKSCVYLQICENGLLLQGSFTPWSRIRSFELRETKSPNRLLVLKGYQQVFGNLEVPAESAEKVELLLRQQVGEAGAVAVAVGDGSLT